MQFPIVLGLVLFSFKAAKLLNLNGFKWISLGWLLNFAYLVVSTLFPQKSIEWDSVDLSQISTFSIIVFDLLTSLSFLMLITRLGSFQEKIRKPILTALPVLAVILVFLIILVSENAKAPLILTDFIAFAVFAIFLFVKTGKGLVFYGAVLYCVTQLFSLGSLNNDYGFILGFISKVVMLYGMYTLFLKYAEEKISLKQANTVLDNLLGSTFHELAKPINQLEENLDFLVAEDRHENKIIYNSRAKSRILAINGSFHRIRAIFLASIDMYEEETDQNLDLSIYIKKKKFSKYSFSVNNLIESAYLSAKANRDKKVEFIIDYAANSDIQCDKYEIIEALTNIINNAIEAVDFEEGKISITVRRVDIHNVPFVQLEIADNGPGVLEELKEKVTELGVTSKKGDGHGFGLFISKKLIEKNGGILEIESPFVSRINPNEDKGTLIRLLFKKQFKKKP